MVSVLPDGAEPRGSNGESCCSRTPVSWHPLTFRCRTPLHCIWKYKPPPFAQLWQLWEVIASAKRIMEENVFYVVCSFFGHPLCPQARRPICVLGTEQFGSRMFTRPWAQGHHSTLTLERSLTMKHNHKLSLCPSRSYLSYLLQVVRKKKGTNKTKSTRRTINLF